MEISKTPEFEITFDSEQPIGVGQQFNKDFMLMQFQAFDKVRFYSKETKYRLGDNQVTEWLTKTSEFTYTDDEGVLKTEDMLNNARIRMSIEALVKDKKIKTLGELFNAIYEFINPEITEYLRESHERKAA